MANGRAWTTVSRAWVTLGSLLIGTAFVGCSPPISDTGYTGTWSRGNANASSSVAIVQQGEEYLFRWTGSSKDGTWRVDCDWAGNCEESVNGEVTSSFRFRTWISEETGLLMVECVGEVLQPQRRSIQYTDELIVRADGKELWSYTIERDGKPVEKDGKPLEGDERPLRVLTKVSDRVLNPPSEIGS